MESLEKVADGPLGRVLDSVHVLLDGLDAVLGEKSLDQRDTARVGSNLRFQVRDVVADTSCA